MTQAHATGHRTQITLTAGQYARLREEPGRPGHGIPDLVRRAVGRSDGASPAAEVLSALDASFASWDDRDFDGAGYVDGLRRGMSRRLTS